MQAALNKKGLKALGITHILNAANPVITYERKFTYLVLGMRDHSFENLLCKVPQATGFIEEAISSGGKVLVHCMASVSRSASIVLAYLMTRENMTYNDAFSMVKEKRSVINPTNKKTGKKEQTNRKKRRKNQRNEGFKAQLKQLHPYMKNKREFHESQLEMDIDINLFATSDWLTSTLLENPSYDKEKKKAEDLAQKTGQRTCLETDLDTTEYYFEEEKIRVPDSAPSNMDKENVAPNPIAAVSAPEKVTINNAVVEPDLAQEDEVGQDPYSHGSVRTVSNTAEAESETEDKSHNSESAQEDELVQDPYLASIADVHFVPGQMQEEDSDSTSEPPAKKQKTNTNNTPNKPATQAPHQPEPGSEVEDKRLVPLIKDGASFKPSTTVTKRYGSFDEGRKKEKVLVYLNFPQKPTSVYLLSVDGTTSLAIKDYTHMKGRNSSILKMNIRVRGADIGWYYAKLTCDGVVHTTRNFELITGQSTS